MEKETRKSIEVQTDIELLTAEVEAHRLVLALLLKKLPDNAGSIFLSRHANAFEKENKVKHALIIREFDILRGLVSSLPSS